MLVGYIHTPSAPPKPRTVRCHGLPSWPRLLRVFGRDFLRLLTCAGAAALGQTSIDEQDDTIRHQPRHTDHHRGARQRKVRVPGLQDAGHDLRDDGHQRRARAEADQAPAQSEAAGAQNQWRIVSPLRWVLELASFGQWLGTFCSCSARMKAGPLTQIPQPMTKARDGSQYPPKSRKFMTFMGFVMPEVPRPKAKMRPEDKGDTNILKRSGSTTLRAMRHSEAPRAPTGNSHWGGHCNGATCGLYPVPSIFKACLVMAMVPAATPMKVGTEIQLRKENLGRPQMPWPLVHPLPTRVPMPTATPAKR
eukprot:Skav232498  [mRNA]  locus=scaffold1096:12153:28826:- [translate_table: standard]